jgi:hypothetical protein
MRRSSTAAPSIWRSRPKAFSIVERRPHQRASWRPTPAPLRINQRFGLNLDERDQLVFDQFEKTWLADQELREVARNNAFEAFLLEFTRGFKQTVLNNEERNREVYELIYGNSALAEQILDFYARKVYTDLRSDA